MVTPLIEMAGITKRFGQLLANDHVNLNVYPGEIVGLLGENGAGKTTLMNILFGTYAADDGSIRVKGNPVRIRNSAEALAAGIGMVHQHFLLAPRLTVMENLLVGMPGKGVGLDLPGARRRLEEIAGEFGLKLDPERQVSSLSVGEQQRLEIIKALFRGAKVLILDEPTAVLAPPDVDGLFSALRAIAARSLGIVFISHKLNEVRTITSRCVILRHGRVTGEITDPRNASTRTIAELMCGQEIKPTIRPPMPKGKELLVLERISTAGHVGTAIGDVSLAVRGGEILGLAGVSGNGQKALADVISGMLRPISGKMTIATRTVRDFTPAEVQGLGLGRVPEDRLASGLISSMSLAESMALPRIGQAPFSYGSLTSRKGMIDFAERQIREFDIRCSGPHARTGTLSGGNLQKALLARELAFDPKVVIVSQPTRGLDIAATRFVHEKFLSLRAAGRAVLVISEDLDELMTLSDRIAVIYEGRIAGVLTAEDVTVSKLGLLMNGAFEKAA
ncbi:ABC transporter ATP-binding protein [Aestuariivirga sp.]|uniref:ABC transporter ATP-binding protein n=1 Tax=Aestuariivirga sp. TaxID=2650926 RepID=UPI003BAD412E